MLTFFSAANQVYRLMGGFNLLASDDELLPDYDHLCHSGQAGHPDTIGLISEDIDRVKLNDIVGVDGSNPHLPGITQHQ